MTARQLIEENEYDSVLILDGFDLKDGSDTALIGVSEDGRAIYDHDKMVAILMANDGMTDEEEAEFISYNTVRALPYMGDKSPIIMYTLFQ